MIAAPYVATGGGYFGMPWSVDPWGAGAQRLHPIALAKHGYEKARRIGMMAMVGGKNKTRVREATTPEFRDLLIRIASESLTFPWRSA